MRYPTGGTSRPKSRYTTSGKPSAASSSRPKGNVSPVTGKPYAQAAKRPTAMDRIAREKAARTWKGAAHLADSAVTAVDAVVPVRAGANAAQGKATVADVLALASMVPVLKPLKAASAGVKAASAAGKTAKAAKVAKPKTGTTVADAVGPAKAAAVREAVGAPKPTPARTPRVPKTKPVEPKTKAAKERYWNQTVPAWNKANPGDPIKVPTSGPTVGKAATDTRRQVAKSEGDKSAAEAATVKAGRRESAKNTSKARGARTRAAKAADPNTPKPARTRSKTKEMPASAKSPVKAVQDADVRGMADRRTKALREDGPSRKDLGVKGRDKAASKATDERVANFEQRMAAVRQARNDGSLPSYETQELTGAGTVPTARPVRPSVKTEKQVTREGVDTERKTRGGMTRIDQGERAASVEAGGKQGRMPASSTPVTKSRVNALKKQHDPKGPNPLTASDDEFKALVQKYPAADREYLVQARNEYKANDRTAANVERLMQPEGRNPGTGARTPTGSKGPDQVPMNATADRNLRDKNPRKGLGKGSQSKDKPGPNARDAKSESKRSPEVKRPKPKGMVASGRAAREAKGNLPRGIDIMRGRRGPAASDGSTMWTSKGTPKGSGDNRYPLPGDKNIGVKEPRVGDAAGYVGDKPTRAGVKVTDSSKASPVQKPPGAADKPKSAPKKPAASKDKPAKDAGPKPKRPRAATGTPAWTKWDPEDITLVPNARDRQMQARLDKVLGDKKPQAPEKPASKPRTSKPKAAAETKPAAEPKKPRTSKPAASTKPKADPKPAATSKPKGKPKAKPKASDNVIPLRGPRGRTTGTAPVSNPTLRNPRIERAEMARDLLKGKGARRLGSKAAAAAIVTAGGLTAYGAAKQRAGRDAAAAAKDKPGPRTPRPADRGEEKAKPKSGEKKVLTDKSGDKYVLDRYGRRISPAEYKRRLAEKKARENAKTPEERLRLYKQQVARREKYRGLETTRKQFGKRASKVTSKPSVRVGKVLRQAARG